MKKKIAIVTLLLTMLCSVSALAAATFSDAWRQGADGVWRVYDRNGVQQKNVWFCDDAVGGPDAQDNWYLLDANGNMVSAGIVRDGSGNFYSLETNHNGYYGLIRHTNGVYDGINIVFSQNHDGTFGAIQNADAINALIQKYGLADISHISNANCVYSSKITGGSNPVNPDPAPAANYTIRYYVNGSLYTTKTGSSSNMKIMNYGNNLLYWEDRNNDEIYYPGEYAYFDGKRTLNLYAVLEKQQVYTLTYYSEGIFYEDQTSTNGKFRVLDDAWSDNYGVQFIGWQDSKGNIWNYGETYTSYTRNDSLNAVFRPITYYGGD